MPERHLVTLTDSEGTTAVVAPELGGWLLRYARKLPEHGSVEALHFSQAVVDRYPREMYAGIPVLFPLVSNNRTGDKEHHYEWNGRLFEMPQHGFARRSKRPTGISRLASGISTKHAWRWLFAVSGTAK